ncbi:MAG TPA: SRPBCC family protein, partial [Thermoleophilaceae bacterium]|nr:SRPBCC family protein [Thermoleophilaceae bacterium]
MVERTIQIAAPPETIYDVVMDPTRLEDWVTIHQALEKAPDGQLKKGSSLTQSLKLAGRKFKVNWTVVENDPRRRVVWEGRGPVASRARVEYEFAPNGNGTRFSYLNEYDLPGGPLGRIAGRAVAKVTEKELEGSLR